MSKNEKSLDVPKNFSAKKCDFFTDKDDFFKADDLWSIQEPALWKHFCDLPVNVHILTRLRINSVLSKLFRFTLNSSHFLT